MKYDYSLMMRENIGRFGISEKKLTKLEKEMAAAHKRAHQLLDTGEQGFVRNLFDKGHDKEILAWAKKLASFDEILIIGIGGSDLGARMLRQAMPAKKKKVHFLGETTDPSELKRVFSKINWRHCAVNPVSKSGNTVETLSVFLAAKKELEKAVGKNQASEQIFVMTEENEGILKALAEQNGYAHITHPSDIGGRWSVLSIVGLLSTAFTGINVEALRAGAKNFFSSAKKKNQNAAMVYAALHYLGLKQGQSNAVLMPYASRLEAFGQWYRQLFAESLGKAKSRSGVKVFTGMTPIAASGPRDQHSQVQLYNEGPFDKLITFIRVEKSAEKINVPKMAGELAFLGGQDLHDLLNIEQEATALALASHKRPNGTLILEDLSPQSIGELIAFFELACLYLAELLDINAFDQPGVEQGKKNMYALLGKEDDEQQKKRLLEQKKGMKKYLVQ